ncbi:hypothetical protein [Alicyclobacillus fastidiosus]|uniref:Uncharacterized protein n=1 Tax=Alicyclobacillus fastidiosus TaxID=392011 RepID=A0ABV5AIB7_9BACL|nr:hypothetical protein [Alicyclobacillus fastidiosus]WEH11135.1 hypothetical protein PYS47_07930 [Alicyclobacillus fastidiosus]
MKHTKGFIIARDTAHEAALEHCLEQQGGRYKREMDALVAGAKFLAHGNASLAEERVLDYVAGVTFEIADKAFALGVLAALRSNDLAEILEQVITPDVIALYDAVEAAADEDDEGDRGEVRYDVVYPELVQRVIDERGVEH